MYKYEAYKRDYTQLPRRFHSFKWVDHPLWVTWHNMKTRCYDESTPTYSNYGGRGIQVCDNWVFDFEQFLYDMGPRPSGFSIDRRDNDGNYTPSNCKWSNDHEQAQNKRTYKTSKTGHGGIRKTNLGYYQVRTRNKNRRVLGVFKTLAEALDAQKNEISQTAPRVSNTTGLRGVTQQGDCFLVRKMIDGKRVYLGNTKTLSDAKKLYDCGIKKKREVNSERTKTGRFKKKNS